MTTIDLALLAAAAAMLFIGYRLGAFKIFFLAASPFAARWLALAFPLPLPSQYPGLSLAASWLVYAAAIYFAAALLTKLADALLIGVLNRFFGAIVFLAAAFAAASIAAQFFAPPETLSKIKSSSTILRHINVIHK